MIDDHKLPFLVQFIYLFAHPYIPFPFGDGSRASFARSVAGVADANVNADAVVLVAVPRPCLLLLVLVLVLVFLLMMVLIVLVQWHDASSKSIL